MKEYLPGIWIHMFSQEMLAKGESQRDIHANHIDKKKSHKYFADMNSLDKIIKMRKELGMVAIHKIKYTRLVRLSKTIVTIEQGNCQSLQKQEQCFYYIQGK